ncbi:MAG: PIN domain-containing protein [Candidatus Wallbacteria bacterium]|nr:PIN domain-containing protein [Candidatus Wallbacteria bacterium]
MMVDTSILVHAANRQSTSQQAARRFLAGLTDGKKPWFLTWPIQYEFLRLVSGGGVFYEPMRSEEALEFLAALHRSASLKIVQETPAHATVLAELFKANPEIKDETFRVLHTACLMKEHGIAEVASGTGEYRRFPGIKVIHALAR